MKRALAWMVMAAVIWGGVSRTASAQRGLRPSPLYLRLQKLRAEQQQAEQQAAAQAAAAKAAADAHRREMHHQAGEARRESAKAAGKREAERRAEAAKKLNGSVGTTTKTEKSTIAKP